MQKGTVKTIVVIRDKTIPQVIWERSLQKNGGIFSASRNHSFNYKKQSTVFQADCI